MPVSADVPYRINGRGGLAVTTRPLPTLVAVSIDPGPCLNAFSIRDGAAGDSVVWSATNNDLDQLLQVRITRRLSTLELQRRAKLVSISKVSDNAAADGRAVYRVEWQDMETGDAQAAVQETQVGG